VTTCQRCESENPDGARFCVSCGSSLAARARLKFAIEVFEELGAARELRRAAALSKRLS
jgi:uncharacterized membrane protein YvbJ